MSKLGTINWGDLLKGLFILIGTTVLSWLGTVILNIQFVSDTAMNATIITVLSAVITYLSKQLGTNETGTKVFGVSVK